MEFLFELFGEIFLETYLGLAEIIVPDKVFKKRHMVLLRVLCLIVLLGSLALTVAGIIYLVGGLGFVAGVAMVSAGGLIILINIILCVIVLAHSINKENRAGEEDGSEDN
ncbi:MAG: hypothetical protein K2L42_05070 [Clostridia bacterium]|nr:hypothetical protein [Clostridia bacterium]